MLFGYTIYFMIMGSEYDFLDIIQNILMIPFSEAIGYKSLIVGQAWSTCYELYFYFLFAVVLFWGMNKKNVLPIILSLFCVGVTLRICFHSNVGIVRYLYSLIGANYILFFCEGILIALFYKKLECLISKKLLLFGIGGISFLYVIVVFMKYNFYASIIITPILFTLVLLGNIFVKSENLLSGLIIKLGDWSFSIYLIHSLVIRILKYNLQIENFGLMLMCTLIGSIGISIMLYKYVEQPFINKGKKISTRYNVKH